LENTEENCEKIGKIWKKDKLNSEMISSSSIKLKGNFATTKNFLMYKYGCLYVY
jgi:hypothetical protein